MEISTTVSLGPDDTLLYTPDAAAAQILAALGANPTRDVAYVTVIQNAGGQAGTPPPPPGTVLEAAAPPAEPPA